MSPCVRQQNGERRKRSCGHYACARRRQHIDADGVDPNIRQSKGSCRLTQKCRLSAVGLHKMSLLTSKGRQNQAWKPRTRPDIEKRRWIWWEKGSELQGINDMPLPEGAHWCISDEVYPPIPTHQHANQVTQPLPQGWVCVEERVGRLGCRFHVKRAEWIRRCTAKAASAAGVMPGSRPAPPSVGGRAASSL